MRDSRLLTTRNLVEAISSGEKGERVLISTSAIGYYGFHGDEELNEEDPPGNDFLAVLCRDWEAEALKAGSLLASGLFAAASGLSWVTREGPWTG